MSSSGFDAGRVSMGFLCCGVGFETGLFWLSSIYSLLFTRFYFFSLIFIYSPSLELKRFVCYRVWQGCYRVSWGWNPFFFGHHRQELLFTRFLTFLCLILSKFYPVFSHLLTVWTGFRRILLDFSSYYLLKRTFTYVYEFFLSVEK